MRFMYLFYRSLVLPTRERSRSRKNYGYRPIPTAPWASRTYKYSRKRLYGRIVFRVAVKVR